jgi:hypothetical protein
MDVQVPPSLTDQLKGVLDHQFADFEVFKDLCRLAGTTKTTSQIISACKLAILLANLPMHRLPSAPIAEISESLFLCFFEDNELGARAWSVYNDNKEKNILAEDVDFHGFKKAIEQGICGVQLCRGGTVSERHLKFPRYDGYMKESRVVDDQEKEESFRVEFEVGKGELTLLIGDIRHLAEVGDQLRNSRFRVIDLGIASSST